MANKTTQIVLWRRYHLHQWDNRRPHSPFDKAISLSDVSNLINESLSDRPKPDSQIGVDDHGRFPADPLQSVCTRLWTALPHWRCHCGREEVRAMRRLEFTHQFSMSNEWVEPRIAAISALPFFSSMRLSKISLIVLVEKKANNDFPCNGDDTSMRISIG